MSWFTNLFNRQTSPDDQELAGASPFSDATLTYLRCAGWSPQRRINPGKYVAGLEAEGYLMHPVVVEFLSRFGGLNVKYPHAKVPTDKDYLEFDPIKVMSHLPREKVVVDDSERVGAPLCVIGESDRGYIVLMMAADGKTYGGLDHYLWRIGNPGEDAIEDLCRGWHFPEVPELEETE